MPVPPAELTAEYTIEGPDEALAAARGVAGPSGLAREAGPGATCCCPAAAPRCWARSATWSWRRSTPARTRFDVRLEAPSETPLSEPRGADRGRARRRAARPRDRGRARVLGVHARVARARRGGLRRPDRRAGLLRRRRAGRRARPVPGARASSTRTCTSSRPSSRRPSSRARRPARDDRGRHRPARGGQRARPRGRRVDARGVRGPAARRLRDGALVRAGERLRVAR